MTKLVHLDAGHGGKDSGAVGHGLYEKNVVLDIVKRVGEILVNDYEGVAVRYTRTNDVFYELSQRAAMANKANADFFLSVHINAGGGTGYEDFIYSGCASGGETDKAREKIHEAVVPVLKKYGIKNRGKKKANYAVLRETNMNAVLVETLFIDNATDANLLKNIPFLEEMCQAYAKGVAAAIGAKRKATPAPTPKPSGTLYRVQVGAYRDKANAEEMLAKLKAAGFEGFVKSE